MTIFKVDKKSSPEELFEAWEYSGLSISLFSVRNNLVLDDLLDKIAVYYKNNDLDTFKQMVYIGDKVSGIYSYNDEEYYIEGVVNKRKLNSAVIDVEKHIDLPLELQNVVCMSLKTLYILEKML